MDLEDKYPITSIGDYGCQHCGYFETLYEAPNGEHLCGQCMEEEGLAELDDDTNRYIVKGTKQDD